MAKQEEILTIRLEVDDLNRKAQMAAGSLENLRVKQKSVKAEFGAGSAEYQKVSEDLRRVQTVLKDTNRTLDNNRAAMKAATGSIEEQRKTLAVLTDQWKKQGTSTDEGKKKQEALAKQIRSLSDDLKKQESAVGNNTRNVGNYTDALSTLNPTMGGIVKQFGSMTKAALAFIATPIGLVLTAIAAAIAPLIVYFTKTADGVDKVEKVMASAGAVMNVFIDRLSRVGEGLMMIIEGDFSGGIDKITNSFKGMGDEMARESELASELVGNLQALEDAERDFSVVKAEQRKFIEEQRLISKDVTKSDQERLAAAKLALEAELKIQDEAVQMAKERVRITREQVEMSNSLDEDLDKLAQAQVDLADTERESLSMRISLNKDYARLTNEIEAQKEAAHQRELERMLEFTAREDEREMIRLTKEADQILLEDEQRREREEKSTQFWANEEAKIAKYNAKKVDEAKKAAKQEKQIEEALALARASLLLQTFTIARSLAKEGTTEYKIAATAENIAATYLGATQAFQQGVGTYPFPYGAIVGGAMAALMVGTGIANQAKILSAEKGGVVKAAKGRVVTKADGTKHYGIGGNLHSSGGTTFYDSQGRPQFEAERDEIAVIMNRKASEQIRRYSDLNQSTGGVSFLERGGVAKMADGGVAIRGISSGIDTGMNMTSEVAKTVSNIKVVAVWEDWAGVNDNRIRVQQLAAGE